jgi:hypothetical protein
MKKFTLSIVVAFTLCVAAAVAQMAPGSSGQGTQQSSPSMSGPQGRQQPGMGQPDQNDPMGQTQDQTGNNNRMDNGEHKMKGCVQSQGGQYVLETKKGKMVALSGQDVSAHVGHEVSVKGTWSSASAGMSPSSSGTASSSGSASSGERTFNVTDVKMISDTCSGKGKHSDNGMGTGANGTNPNGSGTGTTNPSNTGAGTQGPGGTGTQPPQ